MLDKNDLQQIEAIVLKVLSPLEGAVRAIVKEEIAPVKQDVAELRKDSDYLKQKMETLSEEHEKQNRTMEATKKMLQEDLVVTMKDVEGLNKRTVVLEDKFKKYQPV
ncbi:hypothetical protein HQ571_00460 [Candidatus Kuenenbacteria bacterium]|nr:hypothetical protein [Candidatus Kuenenbacteria bacterium]